MDWIDRVDEREGEFVCVIREEDLARTNATLVENGVEVSAFAPRRSLEDYFLSITEQPDDSLS